MEYIENPISIVGFDGGSVTFTVSQTWTSDQTLDWMAISVPSEEGIRCIKSINVFPEESVAMEAACTKGWAEVFVYVHDSSLQSSGVVTVPSYCSETADMGTTAMHRFSLPCECSETPPPVLGVSPTPAPTNNCDYYDLSFDDKEMEPGSFVSTEWEEYGVTLSASELSSGSGGHIPDGHPRLFNTSEPVDPEGYGTNDLGGDFGNVLVVQHTGPGNMHWKANEDGGIIKFELASEIDMAAEIGLLNVVADVWVQTALSNGQTVTIVVDAMGPKSYKEVKLDVPGATSVSVLLGGPTAVTHFVVCKETSVTPSPAGKSNPWPTILPSKEPSSSPSFAPSSAPMKTAED